MIFELTTEDVRNALRRARAGRRVARRPTAGSRSRSSPTWPTTPRAPSPRRRRCGRRSTGPTRSSRSRPPGGAAGDHRGDRPGHQRQRHADLQRRALPRGHGRLPRPGSSRPATRGLDLSGSTRWRRSSSPGSTPRSTSGWRRSAPTRPWRCAARPPSPTRGSPTAPTRRCSPATAGSSSRTPAPTRSGRCGRRPASRTPTTPTPSTSPTWSSPTPSTRCPRRPWTRSPTTARSRATW